MTIKELDNLLRNYNILQRTIKDRINELTELEKHGLPHKSSSVTSFTRAALDYIDQDERKRERLRALRKELDTTQRLLCAVAAALDHVRPDKDFIIIDMYYLKGYNMRTIIARLGISKSAAYRYKNRILNDMIEYINAQEPF